MPVKVYIEPFNGGYRARCGMFGLEVVADSKAEASEKMNDSIRKHVAELTRTGRLPEQQNMPSCTTAASACPGKGCSGCGSSA